MVEVCQITNVKVTDRLMIKINGFLADLPRVYDKKGRTQRIPWSGKTQAKDVMSSGSAESETESGGWRHNWFQALKPAAYSGMFTPRMTFTPCMTLVVC